MYVDVILVHIKTRLDLLGIQTFRWDQRLGRQYSNLNRHVSTQEKQKQYSTPCTIIIMFIIIVIICVADSSNPHAEMLSHHGAVLYCTVLLYSTTPPLRSILALRYSTAMHNRATKRTEITNTHSRNTQKKSRHYCCCYVLPKPP